MPEEPAPENRRDSGFPAAMGKYAPFARLGSGGMADVFLSVAQGPMGFNKLAVLKRLRNGDDPANIEMFLDEARLAARLNHPNVVHTYEVGEENGRYFIAMEYLEGQTLHALLGQLASRSTGLGDALAAYVVAQALKGIHHAHELCDFDGSPLGIVHRDISPHNIYVTYGGEVKVLDFGIAKAHSNAGHTETGILKGKIRYMSPEHIGGKDVDRGSDVFAFGVVLWEMLARRALFLGDSGTVMGRIVNEDAPSALTVRAAASPALDAIALRALRRDRRERYASADAMRADLETFLGSFSLGASERELATVMASVFADKRDQVRQRIKSVLDKLPTTARRSSADIARASELPPLLEDSDVTALSGTRGESMVPVVVPSTSPRWRGLLLAVAGAVGVVGLAGWAGHAVRGPGVAVASPPPLLARGHVSLQTMPPGALVECDGQPSVHSPAEFALDPGTRTMRVSLEGYESEVVVLDVKPGGLVSSALALRPVAPRAVVTASASAAPAMQGGVAPVRSSHPVTPRPSASEAPRLKIRVLDDRDAP